MNKTLLALFFALMVSFLASCGAPLPDEPLVDEPGQVLPIDMQPDTMRLLAIGNSYTMDALADECWDYVTMQQVSLLSHDFTTISPYLQRHVARPCRTPATPLCATMATGGSSPTTGCTCRAAYPCLSRHAPPPWRC